MKNKLYAIAAMPLLALALTSCGEHDLLDTATKYDYCVLDDRKICLFGPFENCSSGGTLSNNCPYNATTPSSSSVNVSVSSGANGKENDISKYKTVTIGEQTWMAENLNYDASGSACYENLESNCDIYGRLYNWATAMDFPSSCNEDKCASRVNTPHRGICPEGWHIPSEADWNELLRYIDGNSDGVSNHYSSITAGKHLKASSGWDEDSYNGSDGNGDDKYEFSALPGGRRSYLADYFDDYAGSRSYWWTSDEFYSVGYYATLAYTRIIFNDEEHANGGTVESKVSFFSVRCLKDEKGGSVYSSSSFRQQSSSSVAKIIDYDFVQDASGQAYKIVPIGDQTWTAENLNYYVRNSYCFDNKESNCEKYGRLYDWAATMAIPYKCNSTLSKNDPDCAIKTPYHQGVCPDGWHVPSGMEWENLFYFAEGKKNPGTSNNFYNSQTAGKLLKATKGWEEWNGNGTDAFEFAALPGGYGDPNDNYFNNASTNGATWWTSSEGSSFNYAYYNYIGTYSDYARSNTGNRELLRSVRCVKDTGEKENDINNYRVVPISGQVWMAENLNYKTGNSLCYDNDESNCAKYGRLYDWPTAKTACPANWHLPSNAEWNALYLQAGSSLVAGGKLKATSGWSLGGNGTDDFGFKALPGGSAFPNGYSLGIGEQGYWWSSSEEDSDNAYYRYMYSNDEGAGNSFSSKTLFFISVRCVKD